MAREVSDPALTRAKPPEPQPHPSRHALDEAKARVVEAERRRRDLQRDHDRAAKDLQAALDAARARYDRAVERWRYDTDT
jgi:cyclopropane fatty-acyl-phospholipid synthase-like methyltransferase